jgi:polyphosphate kinase 2 (PPK2 family)
MSRTTLTVTDEAFKAADADRHDDESWSDYLKRVADADADADTEHNPNTVAVANIDEVARAVGDEVETRMTRR